MLLHVCVRTHTSKSVSNHTANTQRRIISHNSKFSLHVDAGSRMLHHHIRCRFVKLHIKIHAGKVRGILCICNRVSQCFLFRQAGSSCSGLCLCGRGNDRGRLSDTNKAVTGLRYPSCQCEVRGERRWVGPLWVNYPQTSSTTHCLAAMTSICGCLCVSSVCTHRSPSRGSHCLL